MHHRILRLAGAVAGAFTLTGGLLVTTAVAAPAPLDVTSGTLNLSPEVVSYSSLPSPINLGGFQLTATNNSPSTNLPQLYLTNTSGDPVYGYEITYHDASGQVVSQTPTCDPTYVAGVSSGTPWQCSVGPLGAGYSVTVIVALISPSSGSKCPTGSSYSACWYPAFIWSTNGDVLTGTGKNKSRSGGGTDNFSVKFTQPVGSSSNNSAGTYVWNTSQQSISNDTNINRNNPQGSSASLKSNLDIHIPFFVIDGPNVQAPTPNAGTDCTANAIVTQWTEVNANDDHPLNGLLHTTIVVYHGPNPNQVNGICWVHKVYSADGAYTNPDGSTYDWYGTSLLNAAYPAGALCSTSPAVLGDPAITALGACFTLGSSGPNLVINIDSNSNGNFGSW